MKFHHLGQILLDTNCLLLILKMFGLQEVANTVVSKADSPDNKSVLMTLIRLSDLRNLRLASSGSVSCISQATRSTPGLRMT